MDALTNPPAAANESLPSPEPASEQLPSKRPSPWRQPKEIRQAAAALADGSSPSKPKKRKKGPSRRLLLDAISIRIPVTVTADLGIALARTRRKRMQALQKAHPELLPSVPKQSQEPVTAITSRDKDKGETTAENNQETKKKEAKALRHVPQPSDYANVLDYLEAKYVQGVMIDEQEEEGDDDEEGQGSVYSETSFLDDRDLQRNVAEQVLAHTTTTKLELEDDDDFFVNVGNLEVEETELTSGTYDPLEDTNVPKRKRKKPAAGKKLEKATANGDSSPQKKKAKTAPSASKPVPDLKPSPKKLDAQAIAVLKTKSSSAKAKSQKLYQKVVDMIKSSPAEQLPRRKKSVKVSITCPEGKKPGDPILFANPHIAGQKLKVKIPKTTKPGGVFKVSVPTAPSSNGDQNKLNRQVYDALDDYARAFDDWCDIEGELHKADGDQDFVAHFEKRKKFDELVKQMPKNLETPLDKAYLQKILRRARQNRHKREQTMARQAVTGEEEEEKEDETPKDCVVPELQTEFPTKIFQVSDFHL